MAPAPPHVQVGSGKVTDSQVAFMVECYLRDSHFSRTLEEFRSEAARILHPLRAVPKGARSLSAVLNDYVSLKEEQISAAAEKARVESLFHGLQEILSVYLSGVAKNAVPVVDVGKGGMAMSVSPPAHVSSAGTQQPQLHVPYESETVALPVKYSAVVMDQHAKEKVVSSHKRKSQGSSCSESVQQVTLDLAKKPRRGSNVKQSSSNSSPTENAVMVGSPASTTGSDCPLVSKAVQPRTPPMNTISSKAQQQPQSFPRGTLAESPELSPLPTQATQVLVSPTCTSNTPTPPPTGGGDSVQHHQDPRTPPPSSTKSCLNANSNTFALGTMEGTVNPTTAPGNPGNVQQRRKASLSHLPSATSHYSLRAHKKISDASTCIPLSDAQSNCNLKNTRKKATNSKCRLLDFSDAAVNANPQALRMKHDNSAITSPATCNTLISPDPQQTGESSAECMTASQSEHVSQLPNSSPNAKTEECQVSEFPLPCDSFSFDDLFDLDLDTSLLSELEDLATYTAIDTDQLSCSKSSDMAALACAPDQLTRGVLTEIKNLIHSDETLELQTACPSASPVKQRKHATLAAENETAMDNKENMQAVVV